MYLGHIACVCAWLGSNFRFDGNLRMASSILRWTSDIVDPFNSIEAKDLLSKVALIAWHIWKTQNESALEMQILIPWIAWPKQMLLRWNSL